MKAGDKARLGTIRLMLAKIKDKDIELRTGTAPAECAIAATSVTGISAPVSSTWRGASWA